jgi:hypothetical protein
MIQYGWNAFPTVNLRLSGNFPWVMHEILRACLNFTHAAVAFGLRILLLKLLFYSQHKPKVHGGLKN